MSTTEDVTIGTLLQRTGNPEGVREAGLLPIDLSPNFLNWMPFEVSQL